MQKIKKKKRNEIIKNKNEIYNINKTYEELDRITGEITEILASLYFKKANLNNYELWIHEKIKIFFDNENSKYNKELKPYKINIQYKDLLKEGLGKDIIFAIIYKKVNIK